MVAVGGNDIFAGSGVTSPVPAAGNLEIFLRAVEAFEKLGEGLVFATLVDFDTLYGHRNDVEGFANALEEFDSWLPGLLSQLGQGDLVVFTADHGCDPTTPSTDHSREYVPLLITGPGVRPVFRSAQQWRSSYNGGTFGVEQDGTPIQGTIEEREYGSCGCLI